jgi:hypothetical protein
MTYIFSTREAERGLAVLGLIILFPRFGWESATPRRLSQRPVSLQIIPLGKTHFNVTLEVGFVV